MKLIGKTVMDKGFYYREYLFQTAKRYYRLVCERRGDWYRIFVNDSRYGEKSYDKPMRFYSICQAAETIKEAKEIINTYEKNEEVI